MDTTGWELGSDIGGRHGLHRDDSATRDRLRVAKKLLPGQPGSLKLTRKYGVALVCVRYRHDAQGLRV